MKAKRMKVESFLDKMASDEVLPDAPPSVDQPILAGTQRAVSNSISPCQDCLCCACGQFEV